MSMFENKTKPELEAGNFIAYADEPNTIVSGSGGGGGGGTVYLMSSYEDELIVPEFSFKDVKDAVDNNSSVFVKQLIFSSEDKNYTLNLMRVFEIDWSDSLSHYNVSVSLGSETFVFTASSQDETMHLSITP